MTGTAGMPLDVPEMAYQYGAAKSLNKRRKRLNLVSPILCMFAPWILFTTISSVTSFSIHYTHPSICAFIQVMGLGFALLAGFFAWVAVKNRSRGDMDAEPTWTVFFFVSILLAWVAAMMVGVTNYHVNMLPHYDIANLNLYPSVDPSKMRGAQLMDAGRVIFEKGSRIDAKMSTNHKSGDTYCVAPIIMENVPLASYDFWAVGKNCCNGITGKADFECGEYNNVKASGGLRWMGDDTPYHLAVKQAEAAFGIQAIHPLFFEWMADPVAKTSRYQENGFRTWLMGMFCHFGLQFCFVLIGMVAYSKLGVV